MASRIVRRILFLESINQRGFVAVQIELALMTATFVVSAFILGVLIGNILWA